MEALPAAQDDSSGANPNSVKSNDSSPRPDSSAGSPPPNCAICLGSCKNKSFTDSCLHQFCFTCLLTWSKVKAECPLCKQTFRSIIHNVRSNHQYEEYLVVQRQQEEASNPAFSRIDIDRLSSSAHRFRYRTTLTLPRRDTMAIQQLLRHYSFVTDVVAPPAPRRRRSPGPARRALAFRSTVYRHNLWARPLPDFTGRFRTCTPEFYRYNDTQMHRLAPWISRELGYLLNGNDGHISFVMTRVLDLLPQHHINSVEFREVIFRYLGERTDHFLHELYCFASTPYDMTGYDRNVQYTTDSRISTMVNEVISSSDSEASADSDIVMVSSSEPAEAPPGPSRFPVPAYPQSYISQPTTNSVIPIETISHSDTDDDSSEVMVVGYIKPPQERTPEIVDLLGSDSDVIVQETPQPEPIQPAETQESRPVSSVKLTLKRHRMDPSSSDSHSPSDSDDSSYRPQRSAARRRRARGSSASSRYTPPRAPRSSASSSTTSTSSLSTSSYSDDTDDSKYLVKKKLKKSSKESATSSRDRKRNKNRSSHSHHKEKKNVQFSEKDKKTKRKSHSGKGVKTSNKTSNNESTVSAEQTSPALDQPSTSGTSKRDREKRKSMKEWKRQRRDSRENRRLRSVVNVMYNSHNKNTDESNSSANYSNLSNVNPTRSEIDSTPAAKDSRAGNASHSGRSRLSTSSRQQQDTSDSEDNLPLNLTLQKLNL